MATCGSGSRAAVVVVTGGAAVVVVGRDGVVVSVVVGVADGDVSVAEVVVLVVASPAPARPSRSLR